MRNLFNIYTFFVLKKKFLTLKFQGNNEFRKLAKAKFQSKTQVKTQAKMQAKTQLQLRIDLTKLKIEFSVN